jgi:hypothetical protein
MPTGGKSSIMNEKTPPLWRVCFKGRLAVTHPMYFNCGSPTFFHIWVFADDKDKALRAACAIIDQVPFELGSDAWIVPTPQAAFKREEDMANQLGLGLAIYTMSLEGDQDASAILNDQDDAAPGA